jgi:hypothetical protein
MKSSKIEIALSGSGSLFLLIGVFREPLGFPELVDWIAPALAIGCFVPLLVLKRRRRNARLAAGLPPMGKAASKRRFWLFLFIIVVASVSGLLWLPSTGVVLSPSTEIVTSIISCILAVLVFLLGWRYWNKKV